MKSDQTNGDAQESDQLHIYKCAVHPTFTGYASIASKIRAYLTWPRKFRHECAQLGVKWPNGLLLTGPPGVGKTSLIQRVVRDAGARMHSITSADIIGSHLGDTEERLRHAFQVAHETSHLQISVIFIDEIDALCPQRSSAPVHESRTVAQLLTLMDGVSASKSGIQVIAATNRVAAVDFALRRPGRFDWEIDMPLPDATERLAIFREYTRDFKLLENVDLAYLARVCHGYTGADIKALCRESLLVAMDDTPHKVCYDQTLHSNWIVQARHFVQAMNLVGPAISRGLKEDAASVAPPRVCGYEDLMNTLKRSIEWPVMYPQSYSRLGLKSPRGILLYGPPGCGKTSLANSASALKHGAIQLSASMLFSMHMGEGEAMLQKAFHRARLAAPTTMIIDDIDAIFGMRSQVSNSVSAATLLSVLLNEMDGLCAAHGVTVIATSSRPWNIDSALLRPGRFDKLIFVPTPDFLSRTEVLRLYTKPLDMVVNVDFSVVAAHTQSYTCAELRILCHEAIGVAKQREGEQVESEVKGVSVDDFFQAMRTVVPSPHGVCQHLYAEFAMSHR